MSQIEGPDPDTLEIMALGRALSRVEPALKTMLESMINKVVLSVERAVNDGELTSQAALAFWLEYLSYRKLVKKFDKAVSAGAEAAKQLEVHLEVNKNGR